MRKRQSGIDAKERERRAGEDQPDCIRQLDPPRGEHDENGEPEQPRGRERAGRPFSPLYLGESLREISQPLYKLSSWTLC